MEEPNVAKNEKQKDPGKEITENSKDSIFSIEEIRIEELAVDGICGVY